MTAVQAEAKKYFARYSNSDDFDRLMAFYKANPHKNVCDRNESLMRELVENGSVTMIQSAVTGDVVAASISYPLKGEDGVSQKWLEIGTTRSVLNGYPGLFDVMIAMQVMRAYLVEPPQERFVCQMESPAVRKMAHHLGFRPYTPSDELVRVSDATVNADETSGFENWYSAGPEALPVVAQRLMAAFDNGYIMPTEITATASNVALEGLKGKLGRVSMRVATKKPKAMKPSHGAQFEVETHLAADKSEIKVKLLIQECVNNKGETDYRLVKSDVGLGLPSKKGADTVGIDFSANGKVTQNGFNVSTLTHLKSGEKINLDFGQSRFFKIFLDEIRELSKRDLGLVDQPDYTASIAANRQKWMFGFFN